MDVVQERSIEIPVYKLKAIKQDWLKIYTAIVELGHLQIRFNRRTRMVDLRTCPSTSDCSFLERSIAFIQAIIYGFRLDDAMALMKYRDIFMEAFEIGEIRKLKTSHMSRAIGRIIGREGRTKESIENFSKCKFVLHDQRIVVLGCADNIRMAKDGIGRLVQGAEPSSIFNRLRMVSAKLKDKYGSIQTIYENLKN
ncbi:RNA-binding protein PNO1 [Pancytospora philotis]|nr:RNA-binding protein PNO1 [Pancytospora philotis]